MAQTIEGFVNNALDDAKISPLHKRVIGLIAAGYFCDVIDYTIYGSLVPFIIKSGFGAGDAALIGSATIVGLAIGTAGQGEFSDRFGRRFVYQFNLLFFGVLTILGAFAPNFTLLMICRFLAGISLGAEQPLAFAYAGEWAPKRIRGRILAIVHFIGGLCVARRVDSHWHPRPDRLGVPLHAAGIAALSGDARPRRRSDQDSQ